MAKVNYRHLKKRREDEQRKEQAAKLARRGRVPDAVPEGAPPAAGADVDPQAPR
jgi:hypothetical protein